MKEITLVLSDGTHGGTEKLRVIYKGKEGVRVQSCTASMMGIRAKKIIVDEAVLHINRGHLADLMGHLVMRSVPGCMDIAIISH